jgi:hypothetical protein
MGVVVLPIVVPLLAWADLAAVAAMWKDRAGPVWRIVLIVLVVAGIAIGVWAGFWCDYQVSDDLRVVSFPVPAVIFHLEEGQWIDYVSPALPFVVVFNLLAVALTFVLPLALAYYISRKWQRIASARGSTHQHGA